MGEIGGKGGEQGRTVRISQDNISFFKMGSCVRKSLGPGGAVGGLFGRWLQ